MKTSIKYLTPWLAAFAIGGAVALAPVAGAATLPTPHPTATAPAVPGAGTDPLVPYGTDPEAPYRLGYVNSNHDEANTSNGYLDLPF
ncbi:MULTISPECIES: hypothetical protein [unclassified Mycobacterium]|uniref:hypothetical protein n=1 Tax=unclassified Mycobacterium TaxID=2642494 RepID=UPI0029C705C7|nr:MULTISPECIES: hypothetical protein [unclassified Mycobacterium]